MRGCRFRATRLKHPISRIQWISPFCLQTLSILAHKAVRLCAVQFGNYEGVEFPLINTVELNGERTEEENVILKQEASASVSLVTVTSTGRDKKNKNPGWLDQTAAAGKREKWSNGGGADGS